MDTDQEEKETKKKISKSQLYKEGKQQSLKDLLSTEYGRGWMYDLIVGLGVFTKTHGNDGITLARNGGLRDAGLMLLDEVMAIDPHMYCVMHREYNERKLHG